MFRFLRRKIGFLFHAARNAQSDESGSQNKTMPLTRSFDENMENIKAKLGEGSDIIYHLFSLSGHGADGAVIYIDGLANQNAVATSILSPILLSAELSKDGRMTYEQIRNKILTAGEYDEVQDVEKIIDECLTGNTILLVDGSDKAMSIGTKGWEKRNVQDPQNETVIRGPREGFTENLRTNTALIRRRIVTSDLKFESMTIGKRTKTNIAITYIKGIADPKVLKTVKQRLSAINVDAILDSGYIEEYIEDAPFSIFPTISNSEKPDVVAARMLEGRIAIIVDGSPFVLCVPMLFIESFQSSEDYYIRFIPSTINRIIRYLAFFISICAPGIYIALTTFHQELIPTKLLFTIIGARIGTPFPAVVEVLFLLFTFELLREAGLRLPRPVGQTIGIVGALLLGEAAISAGLVGAPVVITVAITTVSEFIVPAEADSSAIVRLITIFFSSILGIYGIVLSVWIVLIHLASLESFGVPYFEGFTISSDLKDIVLRTPLWSMNKRPKDIAHGDTIRSRFFVPPFKPHTQSEEEADGE